MSIILRINDRDISGYLNVQHDEGLDPAPTFSEPQFAGGGALMEGGDFTNNSIENRAMVFPLLLDSGTREGLHQLIRDINGELVRGAQVQFATDSADENSYFDLEAGRLDPEYQFFLSANVTTRATLTLWVRPYARTATARAIASFLGAGAATSFPATGILGDVDALANLQVRTGTNVASTGRMILYGVHPHPSFQPIKIASTEVSSGRWVPQSGYGGSTAPNALASTWTGIPISPTTASGLALRDYLTPPDAHVGRHRVFALARSQVAWAITLYAKDRYGGRLGPTQVLAYNASNFSLVDLGEVQVAGRASGQESVPTQYVDLIAGGASGNVLGATRPLHLSAMMYVPLDISPGMLKTRGGDTLGFEDIIAADSFTRFLNTFRELRNSPQSDWFYSWTKIYGDFYGVPGDTFWGQVQAANINTALGVVAHGGSGFFSLGDPAGGADRSVTVQTRLSGPYVQAPSRIASGQSFEIHSSLIGTTIGARVRVHCGPTPYAILSSFDGSATVIHATAMLATTSASVFQSMTSGAISWNIRHQAGAATVTWDVPGGATTLLSASHANLSFGGKIALAQSIPSRSDGGAAWAFNDVAAYEFGPSVADVGGNLDWRFESFPQRRTFRGTGSYFDYDHAADFRGLQPRIKGNGSPMATGPARVVVITGEVANFQGRDQLGVQLFVRERFSFLR